MRLRSARAAVSLGLGTLALAWAAHLYVDGVRARVDVGEPAQDLGVFLRAADAVLDGHSPYAFRDDQTYAYPPLLAFLAAPIHSLGVGAAMTVSILVSFAAIAGALWLLGVRDWRCYCLVPLYSVTRSAVGLGTIGPLLLLAAAVAWRWRDRLLAPSLAVGGAVALKLLLWPLAAWLAVTRRSRTALAAVGFAVALALVPWAAIGFAGLAGYPSLLDRLADQEASASYSVFAMGVRLHLPDAAATVLAVAVTAVLLAAMVWVARESRLKPRDRDVAALTLALAAALAASPIVWVHYFLLLLVPLALTEPRLSPLWIVPFAYFPLGQTAWPGGDARKLALALATTLVLLAWPLAKASGRFSAASPSRRARALASPSRRARRSPSS